MIGGFNVRINDMVRASFQKEQVNKSGKPSNGLPTADDPNYVNPFEDPLRRVSHPDSKRIIPLSNEIKNAIIEDARKSYTERNGMSGTEHKIVDIENAYIASLPREYLAGASWTLSKFSLDISNQFKDEIIKHNPNWTFGQPFDTSILDGFNPIDPMKNHLDVTV